jgi:redox-sensitive bicupin YhaK (pirin superfamily)
VEGIATRPLYLDVRMAPRSGVSLPVPAGHTAFAYVYEGRVALGACGESVGAGRLAVLGDGESLGAATADEGARFLLLAARPLGEPIARHGPFVMNTREELVQAVQDFQRGTFLSG